MENVSVRIQLEVPTDVGSLILLYAKEHRRFKVVDLKKQGESVVTGMSLVIEVSFEGGAYHPATLTLEDVGEFFRTIDPNLLPSRESEQKKEEEETVKTNSTETSFASSFDNTLEGSFVRAVVGTGP